ncbi:MAG: RNA polymerase sigma factor [Phycisphaerales bacterium]|nr:RNA polymerase sigma factor [Phycisphaerales bacterium]
MTRAEEVHLIELATAGDRAAAAAFIKCHQQSLYAYILRISGRPEVAEDIVQEAFVRALTHLDRFDTRFRFSTWIFTIAKRLYVNAAQRHKPTYSTDLVGAARSVTGNPLAPAAAAEEAGNLRDALQEALLGLPEDQREVVVLFHQLDWPISVIAQHMDMPEGTVKSHLHRGRRRLRELLESCEERATVIEEALE